MTIENAAAPSGIELTPQGEAYALSHLNPRGCPNGIDPHDWRKAVSARIRQHLDLVAAMIALIDDMDDDADLEPSLLGMDDDREGDGLDEGELDDADREPGLGHPEPRYESGDWYEQRSRIFSAARPIGSQVAWGGAGFDDLEDQHDGAEPENEHGPSWAEPDQGGRQLMLMSGSDEGDENSLSLPEQIDQCRRMLETDIWHVGDGEYDAGDAEELVNEDGVDESDSGQNIVGGGSGAL